LVRTHSPCILKTGPELVNRAIACIDGSVHVALVQPDLECIFVSG
jgi:hypothetical protein